VSLPQKAETKKGLHGLTPQDNLEKKGGQGESCGRRKRAGLFLTVVATLGLAPVRRQKPGFRGYKREGKGGGKRVNRDLPVEKKKKGGRVSSNPVQRARTENTKEKETGRTELGRIARRKYRYRAGEFNLHICDDKCSTNVSMGKARAQKKYSSRRGSKSSQTLPPSLPARSVEVPPRSSKSMRWQTVYILPLVCTSERGSQIPTEEYFRRQVENLQRHQQEDTGGA